MAKKLNQQDLLKLTSIGTPPTDSVAFAAKSDGLYQKVGTTESKLSTTAELLDRVKTPVPLNAKFTDTNTTYGLVTASTNGLMRATDKDKLDNIASNANNYSHPTSAGNKHIPSGGAAGQFLKWSASGVAVWAADNNTTYGVATTTANGLMSSTDKSKLNGIASNANNYSLPTASTTVIGGIKVGTRLSISNGVLTATQQTANDFTTVLKNKLDGIATGATNLSLGTTSTTAYRGDRGNAAYTHISDATKHITAAERTSWNDKYTKSEVDGLAKYIGSYNSSNGFLIKTDVARNENSMLVLHIKGNSYAGAVPINTLVQVYNYVSSDSIIQTGALNNGYAISEVKVFYYNNLVYFWVPQQTSFMTMTFQLLKAEGQVNRVASVSNSVVPTTGVEKMVTITPRTAWFKNTLTKVSQLSNDSGYITASASITGNAASATKLQTARTIGGVSFNGTANINLPGVNTAGNQNTSGNAATATTATKLGTATVGSTQLPFYLNAGTATAITQANLRKGLFGTTAIGSTTQPIYIAANGVPTAITGSIANSTTGNAATATTATYLTRAGSSITNAPATYRLRFDAAIGSATTGIFPVSNNANAVITLNRHSGAYESQLGFSSNGNIYYRSFTGVALNTTQA